MAEGRLRRVWRSVRGAGRPGGLPVRFRVQARFVVDLGVLIGAFLLAYLLRFDFAVPEINRHRALVQLPYVVLIQFACIYLLGIHHFVWRYVGFAEAVAFLRAAVLSAAPLLVLRLGLPDPFGDWRVPFSVIVINAVLAFGGLLAVRVVARFLDERRSRRRRERARLRRRRRPVLLVGAGRAGVMAAREIQTRGDLDLEIRGFVDDDPEKLGSVIHGIRVVGTSEEIPRLVRARKIDHVVITIVDAPSVSIRRIVDICEKASIRVRIVPGLYEILDGRVEISRIRDVQIEDLLGREPVRLDEETVGRFLGGKRVLVTGAGGSIGSELARQVARYAPASLVLVERAEFALFDVDRELRERWPEIPVVSRVLDVRDEGPMREMFREHRPEIVFHAAAHKHVPMMEENAREAIHNNVLATRCVATMAGESGAEAFVLISTDKAVCPSSVMGASKRVAELLVQHLAMRYATRFEAVRFGNVMGSAGSVIPIFREQIAAGGPVTVTHPEVTRYFMTIPEAAQLVLQAAAMGEGGEIFVLDMGEPVRILQLAEDMIALSGLKPYEDVEIVFTGLRPGEKLVEELQLDEEHLVNTRHPKVLIGRVCTYEEKTILAALDRLEELAASGTPEEIRRFLNDLLPEARLGGEAIGAEQTARELTHSRQGPPRRLRPVRDESS